MGQDTQVEKEDDRPKWLLELENRKRKPRLAHEVGAGAPCIKCTSRCPGLDLHFWRKICKNCKCGRDDHDVPDDEFPQFDLLFGPSGKPKRRAIVLNINKQQADNEETFEWAPPDTTKELAADYMKALPQDKLPIKGSVGAALRKQQLQKQLPLHDIDHKVCDELSESERKEFEKYLENIKNYVGQGKVSKMITAKPFEKSLITPANASECFSPKHKANSKPVVNLRTPSSFVPKTMKPPQLKTPLKQDEFSSANNNLINDLTSNNRHNMMINDQKSLEKTSSPLLNQKINNKLTNDSATQGRLENIKSPILNRAVKDSSKFGPGRYHHVLENVLNGKKNAEYISVPGVYNPAINFADINKLPQDEKLSSINQHKNGGEELANNRLMKDPAFGQVGYLSNLETINKVPEYSASVNLLSSNRQNPASNLYSNKMNNGSNGQHSSLNYSKSDNKLNNETNSLPYQPCYQRIDNIRSDVAKSDATPLKSHPWAKKWPGDNKKNCGNDENSILADKILSDALLPPSSINSSDIIGSTLDPKGLALIREKLSSKYNAKEEPVDLSNPLRSRELRQEGHLDDKNSLRVHSEPANQALSINPGNQSSTKPVQAQFSCYKSPGNLIINSECLNNPVFPEEAVGTSRIVEDPNADKLGGAMTNLSMNSCKTNVQKCHQCQEGIFVGDVVVTAEKAKDAAWHPGCFVCSDCNELLVDLVYFYYKGKLYCARDLANLLGIPRCFACDELIFVNEYTVAEGHNFHVKHFCCWDCDVPLAGQQYISENDRPLCLPCYQKTYAKTCCSCKQLIAADQQAVAVKNLNFHASDKCFCCASCKKSLLNGRMAIKEDKPFCSKECITMYLNQNLC